MTRRVLTCWMAVSALLPTFVQSPLAQQRAVRSADHVEINGSEHPEMVPDWLTWKHGFRTLSSALAGGFGGFTQEFEEALSEQEKKVLYAEAHAQARRDEQYIEAMERTHKATTARGEERKAAARELFDMELQHRQKILDARDRVLAALSPESGLVVVRWMEEVRRSISSVVPRSELEQFRLPQ